MARALRVTAVSGLQGALRVVSVPAGDELPAARPQAEHRHLVLGEGAGLVRADDRGAAQRLHRREALHQCVAGGHALDAHGQRQGYRREETLRNKGHDDAHAEDERLRGVHPGDQRADGKEQRAECHGADSDPADRARHFHLDGAGLFLHRLSQVRDVAQFGVHACRRHDGAAGARGHAGAREHHVGDFGAAQFCGAEHRLGAPADGHRFASQRGVVRAEFKLLDQAAVRGDQIPFGEEHQVPGDQFFRQQKVL